jgi:diamine N-acetyltransferase
VNDHTEDLTLEPVTGDNYEAVLALDVYEEQRPLIATNTRSLAQAYVYKQAEPYALRSGPDIVGFTMLYPLAHHGEPAIVNLTRIMIDRKYQRQGLGRRAMQLIIENVRARPGVRVIQLSVFPENEAAIKLYEAVGFIDTGDILDGEKVFQLWLDSI